MEIKGDPSHLFSVSNNMVRVLTFNNLMKYLRSVEKGYEEGHLLLEFKTDHSGCIKHSITFDIIDEWKDLDELNERIKTLYGKPNRPFG